MRTPFFVLALVAAVLVVLVELGSMLILGGSSAGNGFVGQAVKLGIESPDPSGVTEPSGRGIPYLALVDVVLLYTMVLIGLSLLVPEKLHAKVQGVATVVAGIVLIIVAIVLGIIAFVELTVMLTLFAAAPFGTLAYLAIWGFFPTGDAELLLGLLLFLKLAACVLLLLAHQQFLQNKGLVILLVVSLVCTLIVSFLHGLVPIILVSIVDDVAAIVFAIVAIIWGLVLAIGAIPSVIRAIKSGA